jgi:microcystin-dependent protein
MSVRLSNWHDKKLQPVFEDLRAKDSALEAQDAQLARVDAALQAQLDAKFLQLQNTLTGNMNTLYTRMLPIGSVIMWGLPLEQKPANFVVCDGTWHVINGVNQQVPDLRGRFALGVGNGYGFKAMGGEYDVELKTEHMPRHKHDVSTGTGSWDKPLDGQHNHYLRMRADETKAPGKGHYMYPRLDTDPNKEYTGDDYKPSQENWYSSLGGRHNHKIYENHVGGDKVFGFTQRHNNMPPYCGLYYLIKVAN